MASTAQGLAPGRPDAVAARLPAAPATAPQPGVWLTYALLVLMALIWGVNFSVLKVGTRHFEPLTLNGLRVLLAAGVLGLLAAARREHLPSRADALRLMGLGVLGHGLYQICFIEGIAHAPASTAALVMAAGPAFIGIVGRLKGVERPSRGAWVGIVLQLVGMSGVVFGSARQSATPGAAPSLLGPGLVLLAALTWAFYAVLLKPYAARVDGLQLSAWTLFGGVAVLVPLALPGMARLEFGAVAPAAWGAVLYSALLAMVAAYLFYYRGVRVVGAVRTSMFSNLQPLVALGVAAATLHERPGPWQLAGAACIAAGLVAAARR